MNLTIDNTHPYLTWAASQPATAKYNVWRQYGINLWAEIASNLTVTNFTDYTVTYTPRGDRYYYKIRAKSGDGSKLSPGYSNTVQTWGYQSRTTAEATIPQSYQATVFPNPFNPMTSIQYGLPKDSRVDLVVYDMMGKVVRTLVSGTLEAGYQQVNWDGISAEGLQVASGMYLYKLTAVSLESEQTFTKTGKMVLLR